MKPPVTVPVVQSASYSMEISTLTDDKLLDLRTAVEVELRKRGLAFSVGHLGERFAIAYFSRMPKLPKLQWAPTGTKNVDALSRDGERYSIKTVWKSKKTGTVYPDVDEPEKQLFEYMLIVKLSSTFAMQSLYQLSWRQFCEVRAWDKRMNAWYVPISSRVIAQARTVFDLGN